MTDDKRPNEEQQRIIDAREGFVVADAGPGTGKTFTMVKRYVSIVTESDADPADVLMITFTDAASREMSARLKGEFRRLSENGCFPDDGKKRFETAQARTFDSLCRSIVMDSVDSVGDFFGFEGIGLSRSATLYTNDTLNMEYFSRFLDRFLREHDGDFSRIAPIAAQNPQDVRKLLDRMMAYGIIPLSGDRWFGLGWKDALMGNSEKMREALGKVNSRERKCQSKACEKMKRFLKDRYLASVPAMSDKEIDSSSLLQVINQDRSELIGFIHDVYLDFIRQSIVDNRLTFGLVEILAFTLLYMGGAKEHGGRYRYLMIDEFQDTNPLQMMISLMLMSEPNLCVVGDWKQGIYGFRYSTVENMTCFEEKVRELRDFLNGDGIDHVAFDIPDIIHRIQLRRNRRSSRQIIDTAYETMYIRGKNDDKIDCRFLFDSDFSEERIKGIVEDEVQFAEAKKQFCIVQDRTDIGSGDSRVRFVRSGSKGEEISDVVKAVKDYICNDCYMVVEGNSSRRICPGDIAVFCRNNSSCRSVTEALESESIPVHLVGDVDIMNTREGKLALAWLKYVSNKDDRAGFLPIMMDLGYTLVEMRTIHKESDVPEFIRNQRLCLVEKKRRITELMSSIFDFYGDLDNDVVQAITTAVSKAHDGSMISIASIISMIQYDIMNGTTYEIENTADTDAVTVMTMHKSKGLEYPVVIAAFIDYSVLPSYKSDDSVFFLDDIFGLRCRKEIVDREGYRAIYDSWMTYLASIAIPKSFDEDRRLLFVTLSRAMQYETIICNGSKRSLFFEDLLSNTEKETETIPEYELDASYFKTLLTSKPKIEVPEGRCISMAVHDILNLDSGGEAGGEGIDYGNTIHSLAEMRVLGRPIDSFECRHSEIEQIDRVLEATKNAYRIAELDCHYPVMGMNVTLSGRIDLFVEYPDHVEIHDWKTDAGDGFLEEYKVQLSVYALAAEGFTGKPARCFIQYVSNGIGEIGFNPCPEDEIRRRVERVLER